MCVCVLCLWMDLCSNLTKLVVCLQTITYQQRSAYQRWAEVWRDSGVYFWNYVSAKVSNTTNDKSNRCHIHQYSKNSTLSHSFYSVQGYSIIATHELYSLESLLYRLMYILYFLLNFHNRSIDSSWFMSMVSIIGQQHQWKYGSCAMERRMHTLETECLYKISRRNRWWKSIHQTCVRKTL